MANGGGGKEVGMTLVGRGGGGWKCRDKTRRVGGL